MKLREFAEYVNRMVEDDNLGEAEVVITASDFEGKGEFIALDQHVGPDSHF